MDVYFSGYGRWANQINEDEFEPIGDDYEAGGVFKLRDIDYKTYGHTDDFNHVRRLLPSINNDDCEFKKIKALYHYANPKGDPKFIYMDEPNRNPAFYCMDSYERINSIAIDNAGNPIFLININKYNKVTDTKPTVKEEDRITATAQRENGLPKERELTQWLRQTWIVEGRPGGTSFFNKLKKYVNTKGSPILEHYISGKDAGFRWVTSAGTTGTMAKKTVLTKVSLFNKAP